MRRIAHHLRAVEPRQAALFLAVAALVAAAAYFGAREATRSQTEPLTLTLTAVSWICETTPAQEWAHGVSYQDSEGNWVNERHSTGWSNVSDTPVTWAVSGGTPPYTLVIDGETRDAKRTYAGADGTAWVSCALKFGETFIDDNNGQGRRYRTQPEVDSGLKVVRATVTDSAGAAADASTDMYMILELVNYDHIMQSGKTYRVLGKWLTVPENVDHVVIAGFIESHHELGNLVGLGVSGHGDGWILVSESGLVEVERSTRSVSAGDGEVAVSASERELDAQMDQVMDSIGRPPSIPQRSP